MSPRRVSEPRTQVETAPEGKRVELPGLGRRLRVTPRSIQIALGLLWVLDGALQCQPYMFHKSLVSGVILPSAQGQPAPIAWSITSVGHFIAPDVGVWNFIFATLQLAIGLGLLVRRTVRPAIVTSVVWSVLVWWFGEGFGVLLTGTASPLTGAPGAVVLYATIGVLVWPRDEEERGGVPLGVASSAGATGPFGGPGALGTWVVLWVLLGFLWLLPANRALGSLGAQLSSNASGQPSWYANFLNAFSGHFYSVGAKGALVLALVSLVIGLGPLVTNRATSFLVAGALLEVAFWVTGMGFGGIMTGSATDPNTGPLVVLLAVALLPTAVPVRIGMGSPIARLRRLNPLAMGATGVAIFAALLLAATYPVPTSDVVVPPPPTTAQQEAGMRPGLPLVEPKNLNTSTPPVLNLRLVAEPKLFDISGKKVWGESYDGDYIGPTIHFVPGEIVNLTLVNELPTWTDLHFHGMHISPSGNADDPFINVPPGKTFLYHFQIPLDQPLGTFWYHDHEMCMGTVELPTPDATVSTAPTPHCQDIESQIYNGLSGTIVVGDDRTLLPPDLRHIPVRTLAIKDMQITPSNHIVENSSTYSISSDNPTVRLVNGQLRPVLVMRPGQTELWRIANEGADIFYRLRLPGYRFSVVGQDGYPVAQVTSTDTLSLPPGKRWDVLVTASHNPGTSWLQTLPINNGPQGDTYPLADLMKVKIAGSPVRTPSMPTGALPTAIPSLENAPIAQNRTVVLSENAGGTVMFINGKQFDPNRSVFSTPAVLGTTEQWTVENASGEVHVFHIHTEHFQVMSINGVPHPYSGEQDTVNVPYEVNGKPGTVVIRIHFTDFTGRVMFHCHIAAHEVAGMMSFINVVDPPPGYDSSLITP